MGLLKIIIALWRRLPPLRSILSAGSKYLLVVILTFGVRLDIINLFLGLYISANESTNKTIITPTLREGELNPVSTFFSPGLTCIALAWIPPRPENKPDYSLHPNPQNHCLLRAVGLLTTRVLFSYSLPRSLHASRLATTQGPDYALRMA